ncbi:Secreted protein [Pseudomonas brassicacearum]
MGGWRLHWLTRSAPRDPESGEGSDAMTGACLTVSQVQSIPWAAASSFASLLLVTFRCLSRRLSRGGMPQSLVRVGLQQR